MLRLRQHLSSLLTLIVARFFHKSSEPHTVLFDYNTANSSTLLCSSTLFDQLSVYYCRFAQSCGVIHSTECRHRCPLEIFLMWNSESENFSLKNLPPLVCLSLLSSFPSPHNPIHQPAVDLSEICKSPSSNSDPSSNLQ